MWNRGLCKKSINEQNIIDIGIECIEYGNMSDWEKEQIVESLAIMNIQENRFLSFFQLKPKNKILSFFHLKSTSVLMNFQEIFIKKSSIENLFKAFDNNYIQLDMIIENIFFNKLPIYLKYNKLYTIYENREISTERKVNLKKIKKRIDFTF